MGRLFHSKHSSLQTMTCAPSDYDDAATVQHTEALAAVQQVEQAFRAWLTVRTEPSAVTFLQELLCRSIIKR
jgi:hypothetical protein